MCIWSVSYVRHLSLCANVMNGGQPAIVTLSPITEHVCIDVKNGTSRASLKPSLTTAKCIKTTHLNSARTSTMDSSHSRKFEKLDIVFQSRSLFGGAEFLYGRLEVESGRPEITRGTPNTAAWC